IVGLQDCAMILFSQTRRAPIGTSPAAAAARASSRANCMKSRSVGMRKKNSMRKDSCLTRMVWGNKLPNAAKLSEKESSHKANGNPTRSDYAKLGGVGASRSER